MLNRATFVSLATMSGVGLLLTMLVTLPVGPRASQPDLGSTSISIEDLHRRVDHTTLPISSIPEP
jgi:hypothetical protein